MKFIDSIINKVKTRKFILGFVVLIITVVVCSLILRNWDWLKTIVRGS
jgi:hypothetical protein